MLSAADRPDLTVLRSFATNSEIVDIAEYISDKYDSFSVCLLDDTQGVHLTSIKHSSGPKLSNILHEVFVAWLAGSGKKPVTWMTFVKCLRNVKLNTLADIIEEGYQNDSSEVVETTTQKKVTSTETVKLNAESSNATNTSVKSAPITSSKETVKGQDFESIKTKTKKYEHPVQDPLDFKEEFRRLRIRDEEWENLCRALNVADEETMFNLRNYYNSGAERLYYCTHLFFRNNIMGTVTWEKTIHALACNPPYLVTLAKVIAMKIGIDYYQAVGTEKPPRTLPQNLHRIDDVDLLDGELFELRFRRNIDICAVLNVDETTIADLNRTLKGDLKWEFCIYEYVHHGIGTWENVMKQIAGSPLNEVVTAKRIGTYYGINYYTAVSQDKPIHSPHPNHHKIKSILDLEYAVIPIIPLKDWEVLCTSLKVDKLTMFDLKRRHEEYRDIWEFCLIDYLKYGAATWEDIVHILASRPFGQIIKAKILARKYNVDFYAAMGWNNPASNLVLPNHHQIEDFDDFKATLSKNIPHEAWKSLCRQLKVDEATLTDVEQHWKTDARKWEICLRDFFDYGVATWERVIQAIVSAPLNQVVMAKKIAEDHGISYQEIMKDHNIVKDEL